MPDFGIFRGFNEKLFGDKLYAGQLPINLGMVSEDFFVGLLDIYPNAAAAYSLRKLRKEYTGSAIKVRRASDNTEQDIGFVNNELEVADLQNFCIGTDGFVTTWYDQSGNGRNLLQGTALNQPQIVSSGSVLIENGKPCANFTSNNKRMETIDNNLFFNDCTISYVSKSISLAGSVAPSTLGYGNQNVASKSRYLGPFIGNFLSFVVFGVDYISTISAAGDTTINLYSSNYIMSTNGVTVYKNAVSQSGSPGTIGTTTGTAKFSLNSIAGRNESATINFSEGVFYDFNNNSNLVGIRANQNLYYGIY
jgi:hypothetical protein